jgi:predicted alpha/beta hydrolase family esterase
VKQPDRANYLQITRRTLIVGAVVAGLAAASKLTDTLNPTDERQMETTIVRRVIDPIDNALIKHQGHAFPTESDGDLSKQIVELLTPYASDLSQYQLLLVQGWGEKSSDGFAGPLIAGLLELGINVTGIGLSQEIDQDYKTNIAILKAQMPLSTNANLYICHSLGVATVLKGIVDGNIDLRDTVGVLAVAPAMSDPRNYPVKILDSIHAPLGGWLQAAIKRYREDKGGRSTGYYKFGDTFQEYTQPLSQVRLAILASDDDNGNSINDTKRFARSIGAISIWEPQDAMMKKALVNNNSAMFEYGSLGHFTMADDSLIVARTLGALIESLDSQS